MQTKYILIQGPINGIYTIIPKDGGDTKDVTTEEWQNEYRMITAYIIQ